MRWKLKSRFVWKASFWVRLLEHPIIRLWVILSTGPNFPGFSRFSDSNIYKLFFYPASWKRISERGRVWKLSPHVKSEFTSCQEALINLHRIQNVRLQLLGFTISDMENPHRQLKILFVGTIFWRLCKDHRNIKKVCAELRKEIRVGLTYRACHSQEGFDRWKYNIFAVNFYIAFYYSPTWRRTSLSDQFNVAARDFGRKNSNSV